jgi:hypothetical protein
LYSVHWPDEFTHKALVKRSSSLFLGASRAMDFIDSDNFQKLDILLDGPAGISETGGAFRGLESVCISVLEQAYPHSSSGASLRPFVSFAILPG